MVVDKLTPRDRWRQRAWRPTGAHASRCPVQGAPQGIGEGLQSAIHSASIVPPFQGHAPAAGALLLARLSAERGASLNMAIVRRVPTRWPPHPPGLSGRISPMRTAGKPDPRVVKSRETILSAARTLLQESGPAAVTHQRVAARAGVGRATVYRHWRTPELLLSA